MSKELEQKQIEEIRKDIFAAFGGYAKWEEDWQSLAEAVYNAGYRKQKQSEWSEVSDLRRSSQFYCLSCKGVTYFPQPTRSKDWKKHCPYNFCPNCGAKMKGGAE